MSGMGEPMVTSVTLGNETIAQLEHEVMQRARRLRGWEAASALHARTRVDGISDMYCDECSTPWPCRTASALGLSR